MLDFIATKALTYVMIGYASWYGHQFQGKVTASGELFDVNKLTAAHRTLPLGTILKVTNLDNGKTVYVKVNDRGPFVKGRVLDLSYKAANKLSCLKRGIIKIEMEVCNDLNNFCFKK